MLKLKKTALSLFGLAVMLICVNPPQATRRRGGFDRASVSASGLRSSVSVRGAGALCRLPAGSLLLWADVCSPGLGLSPRLLRRTGTSFRGSSIASSWCVARTGGGKRS